MATVSSMITNNNDNTTDNDDEEEVVKRMNKIIGATYKKNFPGYGVWEGKVVSYVPLKTLLNVYTRMDLSNTIL